MQECAYGCLTRLNVCRFERDHPLLLPKFCVWPDGQILTDEYGSKLRKHFSLSLPSGLRMRIYGFLKRRILFVLKMSLGIKMKRKKEICQIA